MQTMKKIKIFMVSLGVSLGVSLTSCFDSYLDIVPDGIATIENAFTLRSTAERFLFTCYSWLPSEGSFLISPALVTADELWSVQGGHFQVQHEGIAWGIAKGQQNIVNPIINNWDGANGGNPYFRAIRECNIFLENIQKVPDMEELERTNWSSEVTFLKAYYHFLLLRQYGPIPIVDKNLPISSSIDEVKVYREPIDKCFDYIVKTMASSEEGLPDIISDPNTQKGRIDKTIVKSIKAQVLVYAASPLFNGNTDYVNFLDPRDGQPLFNQIYDSKKWQLAAEASKEAVKFCEDNGILLNKFTPGGNQNYSSTTVNQLSFRESVAERTNPEFIWGRSQFNVNRQQEYLFPRGLLSDASGGGLGTPLKMVEKYYSNNGVPIDEDKTWNYAERFELATVNDDSRINLINGYQTAKMNFNREDRFYASLGFDGGRLLGQGKNKENEQYDIKMRKGSPAGVITVESYIVTGYWVKKLLNYQTTISGNQTNARWYYWPTMRLSNLYLLCAEACNEAYGPNEDTFTMLDKVRARVGLKGVKESWTNFSTKPTKFESQEGLREIIHRERTIELMFEGQRAWDLRRWKTATTELNAPITGWNMFEKSEKAYYTPLILFDQEFMLRDYFWPLKESTLLRNRNLKQNPGW